MSICKAATGTELVLLPNFLLCWGSPHHSGLEAAPGGPLPCSLAYCGRTFFWLAGPLFAPPSPTHWRQLASLESSSLSRATVGLPAIPTLSSALLHLGPWGSLWRLGRCWRSSSCPVGWSVVGQMEGADHGELGKAWWLSWVGHNPEWGQLCASSKGDPSRIFGCLSSSSWLSTWPALAVHGSELGWWS